MVLQEHDIQGAPREPNVLQIATTSEKIIVEFFCFLPKDAEFHQVLFHKKYITKLFCLENYVFEMMTLVFDTNLQAFFKIVDYFFAHGWGNSSCFALYVGPKVGQVSGFISVNFRFQILPEKKIATR